MDITRIESAQLPTAELAGMTTQQLRAELARSLQLNAEQLLHLAAIWRELERRGEDLSDLRSGMGAYLPLIASGRLAADAVVRFAGQATLLRALDGLPLEKQQQIANDAPIPVTVLDDDGQAVTKSLPAYSLTAAQVRQVFAGGRVRDAREQEAVLLQTVTRRRAARSTAPTGARIKYSATTDIITIGRQRVPASEILAALVQPDDEHVAEPDSGGKWVNIQITDDQHRRLRVRAAEAGQTMTGLARMAMRRMRLI